MLTRRQLLQHGLAATGAALLTSQASRISAAVALPGLQLTPFVDPLPFPPEHVPVRSLNPAPNPAVHQYFNFVDTVLGLPFLPPLLYEVDQQEAFHLFHPALPPTSLWSYSGLLPGLTFRVYQVTQATHREVQAQPYLYASTQQ